MKNTLLGVIAVCLFMITLKLYVPEANAEVAGMDDYDLTNDYDFNNAVRNIVQTDCYIEEEKQFPYRKHEHGISCD